MQETSKNIGIGILVAGALGLVVAMLLFLHPSIGDGANTVRVRFSNIDKIGVGTRVTFAGKPVGEVVAIHMVPEAMKRTNLNGNDSIFTYELTLRYDSHVHVFDSDEISVKTSGLMGERTIAITPRRLKTADPKPLNQNDLLYASSAGSVEDGIASVTKKMEQTMDDVITLLERNQEDIHITLKSIEAASSELEKILKRTNDLDIVGSCKTLITKFDKAGQNINTLLAKVSSGEGSFGKMIAQDDFYLKSLAVVNKANILMNDVNQYGMLFHLDKGWQRERRRRIDELTQLETPKAFQNFLNEEMQKITLSIARVNMALDKADDTLDGATGTNSTKTKEDFARSFAELLGYVHELENTLKNLSDNGIEKIDEIADRDQEKSVE